MATKSHLLAAMSSMALRCLSTLRPPSNHVISTLNHLPHCSAASLPWAHQVAPRPAFEKAALSGLPPTPRAPAAAAAAAATVGAAAAGLAVGASACGAGVQASSALAPSANRDNADILPSQERRVSSTCSR